MDIVQQLLSFVLHLDVHLSELIANYGLWTYAILFVIIFCETGLIVFPLLPGDSLLFAAGALAAITILDVHLLVLLLSIAAILGDSVNYSIGKLLGPKIFHHDSSRLFNKEHLHRAHEFYERYGGKTIVIARFLPIIRTFVPFVTGIARMTYARFMFYNVFGAFLWIVSLTYSGYFFGNIPFVKKNFSLVIVMIILISLLPGILSYMHAKYEKKAT